MKTVLFTLICFFSLAQTPAVQAQSSGILTIEGFTTSEHVWSNPHTASVCCKFEDLRLDLIGDLTDELSLGLSQNPAIAERQALARFDARQSEIRSVLTMQSAIMKKALEYRLDRFPALVFNGGESVIYGVTDIERALAIYRTRGERQ